MGGVKAIDMRNKVRISKEEVRYRYRVKWKCRPGWSISNNWREGEKEEVDNRNRKTTIFYYVHKWFYVLYL